MNAPLYRILIAERMWEVEPPIYRHINALHDYATAMAVENERLRGENARLADRLVQYAQDNAALPQALADERRGRAA